jgi:sigma-B regulation protein RsbU (phosphoserine phosphatase)
MQTTTFDQIKLQLEDRRERLQQAVARAGTEEELVGLLAQVDAALGRLGTEEYGVCVVCKGESDEKDLLANPLMNYCLCDLSPEQQRALEHDLGLARRIQVALLPDPDARLAHWDAHYRYEPAGAVSGDYCDWWTRPGEEGTLYFAMGDVSGKGVAASLLMAHLHAFFHSQPEGRVELCGLVQRANRLLLESTLPTHYATLVVGRANSDGEVEMVNAGHCPPLVWRSGGLQALPTTGFPIGLMEDKPFGSTRLTLGVGEGLLLYTDGVSEARRGDGREYGTERVEEVLQTHGRSEARHLVRRLREDLGEFLDGAPRIDDLSLLVIRRT